jgi:predicted RNA-binding protein with PUA-like domain
VRLLRKLKRIIALDELRAHARNARARGLLILRRGNRLSVTPVAEGMGLHPETRVSSRSLTSTSKKNAADVLLVI